ncbi:hypothetical protein [Hyperthermus butylicus]|uniref:hypothetical protein n=1 Tax=Hyperthermus butylicus TaxID=54248 RepID=UPI00129A4C8B|nr:hypothetical protein [Hyperthermus butylicus]
MVQDRDCSRALREACDVALSILSDASEALGKGRGRGSGLARLLRRAAETLSGAVEPCIAGCWGSVEPRCTVGELADRLQAVLQGVALRVEKLPRLESEVEVALAEALVDTVYGLVEALCRSGMQLG